MKSNTIVLIVVTLLIVGGLYWYVSTSSSAQAPLTATTSNNVAEAQFQKLVDELQSISFSTAIFSDPRFTSLTNLATPVTPEPPARPDPFAPITGVATTSGT
jgi:hypothetical protein